MRSIFCVLLSFALWASAQGVTADQLASTEQASLTSVLNYHRIDASLVTGGQISPAHVPLLREEGVDLIVNLSVADPERNRDEAFAVASAGITYVNIPVVWEAPKREDLDLFLAIMDGAADKHVLVHCFANYRASAFTYLHRVLRGGVDERVVRSDLEVVWNDEAWTEYPHWRKFVDEALR